MPENANECKKCRNCSDAIDEICYNERVFFFRRRRAQILFEAIALLFMLLCCAGGLMLLYFTDMDAGLKRNLVSFAGGFLGSWTFDVKWFYKSVANKGLGFGSACPRARAARQKQAKGKGAGEKSEESYAWMPQRIYWRLFVPLVSGVFAFSLQGFVLSGLLFSSLQQNRAISFFSISYIIGLFADIIYSKLAKWVETNSTRGK